MEGRILTADIIDDFRKNLELQEKSTATIEKYIRDVKAFSVYAQDEVVTKEIVIAYKNHLQENYAVRSVNSMLASINSLFVFLNWFDLRVKSLKLQQQVFCSEEKELTRAEYKRLCQAAKQKKNERLNLIIQTICATGIRVSELQYITVAAAKCGEAIVNCKAKTRSVFIVKELETKIAPLCSRARNKKRYYFCNEKRQTHKPHEHLARNESLVQRRKCQSAKSISA